MWNRQVMARVIGLMAAFVALAAGLIAGADPMTNLTHSAFALFIGWSAATVWQALIASTSVLTAPKQPEIAEEMEESEAAKQQAA